MGAIFAKAIIITLALLFFAVPGYILKKKQMIDDGGKKALGNVLLYVCQPAMILNAFTVFSDADYAAIKAAGRLTLLQNFALCALVSLLALLLVLAVTKAVFVKSKNRAAADVYTYIAVFSNCGFLGVPFVQMFTDGNAIAVMYLMVFNLVFVILIWTLGVYLITHDRKELSAKKVLLNPTIIATALALLLFFVPEINIFMLDGCQELQIIPQALSAMTAPLAMILVGIAFAELPVKSFFTDPGVYIAGGLRLIVAPFITLALAVAMYYAMPAGFGGADPASDYIFLAPVMAMAMSPASLIVAMAEHYDKQKSTAAKAFVTNTLFSVVTIPLVVAAITSVWAML